MNELLEQRACHSSAIGLCERLPLTGNRLLRSTSPLAGRRLLGVLWGLGVMVARLPMKSLAGGPFTESGISLKTAIPS